MHRPTTISWAPGRSLGALGALFITVLVTPAGAAGPDVIVGDMPNTQKWGTLNNVTAYSIGTTSCNIGTAALDWIPTPNPNHPVIAQNIYRVKGGRIEQIGQSWLKHGFAVAAGSLCGNCGNFNSNQLGVNCSDPYSAGLNGNQSLLGPRSKVNAFTGAYIQPFNHPTPPASVLAGRVQVRNSDLTPALNQGAAYFIEAEYIHPQDSAAGNGKNNASYRRVTIDANLNLSFSGPTVQQSPAIEAWKVINPDVKLFNVDIPHEGRMILGVRSTGTAGTFQHEVALFNLNSDRAAQSLTVTTAAGGVVSNTGFHDVDYFNEPYPATDWSPVITNPSVKWSTQTFAQNPNANALRWGTLYNFSCHSTRQLTSITIGLFKPGTPTSITVQIPPILVHLEVAVAPGSTSVSDGEWASNSEDVELGTLTDSSTFRVYCLPGVARDLKQVTSSSDSLTVAATKVEENGMIGWDVRVAKAPQAPEGYFETVLSLESKTEGDSPLRIRAFGEIVKPPAP
jgi:hypothetical protein